MKIYELGTIGKTKIRVAVPFKSDNYNEMLSIQEQHKEELKKYQGKIYAINHKKKDLFRDEQGNPIIGENRPDLEKRLKENFPKVKEGFDYIMFKI